MKRKRVYLRYKPSGIEWLGDVPEHWEVKKVSHTTYVKGRIGWQGLTSDEFIDEGPYCITGTDFSNGKIDWGNCYHVSEERYQEDPYICLKEGDLLITKDGTIGKTAIVTALNSKATLNSGIFLTRPIKDDYITIYMYWLLNSKVFTDFIELTKTGTTISHLYQNVFVRFSFPLPPLTEQQAIAAFLDHETHRIDTLVTKKERLTELLREKRSTMISNAVTKGLDPSVKVKPSDVEWIGDVPEHWEVKKLKLFYSRINSGDGISPDSIGPEGAYPVYGGNGIMGYTEDYNSNSDDIIIGRVGAKCGNVYLVSGRKWISDNALNLSISGCDKFFLLYFLDARNLNQLSNQNAQPLITGSMVGNQYVALPPLPEQQAIVAFLDRETGKIDALIAKVEDAIVKLKEYRTALISAAVTGKIDVREAA